MDIVNMFECGVKYIIKWGEMMWLFKTLTDGGHSYEGTGLYLGEAGNSSYGPNSQIHAVRIGNEVLVTSQRQKESHIIPADITIVKGFGDEKDGCTLMQIMAPDRVYDYSLNVIRR